MGHLKGLKKPRGLLEMAEKEVKSLSYSIAHTSFAPDSNPVG